MSTSNKKAAHRSENISADSIDESAGVKSFEKVVLKKKYLADIAKKINKSQLILNTAALSRDSLDKMISFNKNEQTLLNSFDIVRKTTKEAAKLYRGGPGTKYFI